MATPSKTEQESQSHKGEEFLKLSCFGHVGVFKVESPLLEVAEELLDSPTQLVKGEGLLSMEAVAHKVKPVIPTPLASDGFADEKEFHPKDGVRGSGLLAFTGGPVFAGQFAPDNDVGLNTSNVANILFIKPFKPVLPSELTVHSEDANILGVYDSENFLKELDSLFSVGVPAFGGLRKDSPNDRNRDFVHYDADSKYVDVTLAMLPIGSVHRKNPTALGSWDFGEN